MGTRGVFLLDSENWDRRLSVYTKLDRLYHGRFSKNECLEEVRKKSRAVQRVITDELQRKVAVRAGLVVYGPTLPWNIHRIGGVDVIGGFNVRRWLRRQETDGLTEADVERTISALQRALPPRYQEQER